MSAALSTNGLRLLPKPALDLDAQAFLLDCQSRNLAKGTIAFYSEKLTPLIAALADMGVTVAADVTPTHLRRWLADLQASHTPGGCHAFYRAGKAFFAWLVREGELTVSPFARVRAPKVADEPLQPVTIEQVKAMIAVCPPKSLTGLRDKAILLALLDTGARAAEFTALTVGDCDMHTGACLIRLGKGRKPRVTFMGAKSRRALLAYLKLRPDAPMTAPLFAADTGDALTYSGLREIIRRRAKAAHIAPAPSLHSFRRAFALGALRGGCDVVSLQRLMGHADLSVLRRYLAQTEGDLQRAHEKASPVDRLL